MRDEPDNEGGGGTGGFEPGAERGTAFGSEDPLEDLMQPESDREVRRRLEADAFAAAEAAIIVGEHSLTEAASAAEPLREAARAAQRRSRAAPRIDPARSQKLWILRVLLTVNLLFMVSMLFLPEATPVAVPERPPKPPQTRQPAVVDPIAPTRRRPGLGLPDDKLYEAALLRALDGEFDDAAARLQDYLRLYPDLNPAVRRLIFGHLAYYLRKAGRLGEALDYENKARHLIGSTSLPEDLIRAAIEAEKRGDAREMRRAYASFLLQEKLLSPTMRALVAESYLKLGDSYRVEATEGIERADEEDAQRMRRLDELRGKERK